MRNRIRETSKAVTPSWMVIAGTLVALVITLPAAAQITRGSISGLVMDTSGAVMPGATLTITETNTNVSTRTKSEPDGLFLFAGVLPGSYTLKVEARGFQTLVKTNLNLEAGERLAVGTLQLMVGSERQTVTIASQGELVQTDTADRGESLTTKEVANLPMAGRNWA